MSLLLPFHILAGATSLVAGAVAMFAAKGGPLHRKAGTFFACAMLFMSGSGAVMAMAIDQRLSVGMGALTFYMVATSWVTVRRTVEAGRRWYVGLMGLGFAIAATGIGWAMRAASAADGRLDGTPAAGYLFFAAIALLAAMLDARLLRAGAIAGVHRLARHLWRMGFALFVAYASFFLGQADEFPESLRIVPLLMLPVLAVVVAIPYFLVRVLWRGRRKARASAPMGAEAAGP